MSKTPDAIEQFINNESGRLSRLKYWLKYVFFKAASGTNLKDFENIFDIERTKTVRGGRGNILGKLDNYKEIYKIITDKSWDFYHIQELISETYYDFIKLPPQNSAYYNDACKSNNNKSYIEINWLEKIYILAWLCVESGIHWDSNNKSPEEIEEVKDATYFGHLMYEYGLLEK